MTPTQPRDCFVSEKRHPIRTSFDAGMPDFSWYKIPKREKYTKLLQTIPNVHKI
jgi:hypothetical protein